MPTLPSLSGREVVQYFLRAGWRVARQRGSHIILVKDGHNASLSVLRPLSSGATRLVLRRFNRFFLG